MSEKEQASEGSKERKITVAKTHKPDEYKSREKKLQAGIFRFGAVGRLCLLNIVLTIFYLSLTFFFAS
jgi:hypothetical protein